MADATKILNEISGALDGLATIATGVFPDDRTFLEMWGWNQPAINRTDLAEFIRYPKEISQRIDSSTVSDVDLIRLVAIPQKIQLFQMQSLPQLNGGNLPAAYIGLLGLITSIQVILSKYDAHTFDLQAIEDRRLLPAPQLRELRRIAASITRLNVESGELEEKIGQINSAHSIAEALPADIQSLEDARQRYIQSTIEVDEAVTSGVPPLK